MPSQALAADVRINLLTWEACFATDTTARVTAIAAAYASDLRAAL